MALNFPVNPFDGQVYPNPSVPGLNVYQYEAVYNTWRLLGRAGYAQSGTYGDNVTCVEITIDGVGIIRSVANRPIPDVTNTQKGLLTPGIGLNVVTPGQVDLSPPLLSYIGGVKAGANTLIASDGTISIPYATLVTPGVVILNNTTSSTDTTQALTAAQGKYLQDQISSLVTDALTFCGTFNASTSLIDYVTYEGSLKGFVVGQNLPAPSAALDGTFVVVSVPGTPVAPAPVQAVGSGDWVVCDINPTQWVVVPIGRFIVASQVIFNPYSYVTGANVQLAIDQVIDRTNFFSLSGGTGLSDGPYTLAGGAQTINLLAPTATEIGGVRAGSNIVISPSGVISVVAGGGVGTVLAVDTGTGLTGGPITSTGTVSIANTGVTAGSYSYPTLSINAQGQITLASSNTPVTSLTAGVGMAVSAGTGAVTVSQTDTGVASGDYTFANISINSQGRVTTASSGSVVAGSGLSGGGTGGSVTLDVGAGTGITVSADSVGIANTGVAAGSYNLGNFTVNAQGQLTAASSTSPASVAVTTVTPGTGLSGGGGPGAISLSLSPPTGSDIGGVKAGSNVAIAADGTISVTPGGSVGTITGVSAGAGLTGGGVSGVVTLDVGAGTGITVAADTVGITDTGVVAGSYVNTSLTVNAQGQITSAANGDPQAYHYRNLDDISSGFNGTTTVFNLTIGSVAYTPNPSSNIMVFLGGVPQIPTSAYTVSGNQITFTEAPALGVTFYANTVTSA